MTKNRVRPARVDDAAELTQIAVRATKNDGYDDDADPLVLLEGIFVDPAYSQKGVGTRLFATAIELSRKIAGNVILITSSPRSVGFYARLGANKIGMTPFVFSPDVQLSMFAFEIPPSS